MSRYWSPVVHTLQPYVPGEQPAAGTVVKLNTNENPYGPSPKVLAALSAEIGDGLRLYPDPGATRLREALARRHGLEREEIFVGNGSDEVLAHAFQALFKHEAPLLFPIPTRPPASRSAVRRSRRWSRSILTRSSPSTRPMSISAARAPCRWCGPTRTCW